MDNDLSGDSDQIESLLLLEIEDLYVELGKDLSRKSMGMSGSSPEKNRLLGKNWFSSQHDKLSSSICKNDQIQLLLSNDRVVDSLELTSLIADILSSQYIGIPVFTLSALIVKTGLGYLCKEDE
jgi:hypothetical protein